MKEVHFSRAVKEVQFGAWVFDLKRQVIFDNEVEKELEPLLFKLLSYLIINKGEILTRDDLSSDVWGQNYVDDNAINRAISELRKLLKSEQQKGIVIKTHHRKGYSFFLEPKIIYEDEQHVAPEIYVNKPQTNTINKKVVNKKNKKVKIDTSIKKILKEEEKFGIKNFKTYQKFGESVYKIRENVVSNIQKLKKENKTIIGYGAPAKAPAS